MDSLQMRSVWEQKQELRKEIEEVESARVKGVVLEKKELNQQRLDNIQNTFLLRDKLALMGEEELTALNMMTQQRDISMTKADQMEMTQENVRLTEKKEKESTQKKRAHERLQKNGGNVYFQIPQESLEAERELYLRQQRGEIEREQNSRFTGHEFDRDPESGEMVTDIHELLVKKSTALNYIKEQQTKADRKELSEDEALIFAERKKVFELLNETIDNWYLANGMDFKSGKRVSERQKNKAKEQFALKLERYQEAIANVDNAIGYAKLAQIRKKRSAEYRESLAELEKARRESGRQVEESREGMNRLMTDSGNGQRMPFLNQFEISPMMQQTVVDIRDMIRENEENYHQHKELVDRIYRDYLENAVTVSRLQDEQMTMSRFLNGSLEEKAQREAYRVATSEMARQRFTYEWNQENQFKALRYLLKGAGTGDFSTDVYLSDRYGIKTRHYQQAQEKAQEVDKLRDKGMSDAEIADHFARRRANRRFDQSLGRQAGERVAYWESELERRKAAAQAAGDGAQPDALIADLEYILSSVKNRQLAGAAPEDIGGAKAYKIMHMLESEESIQHFCKKQRIFRHLLGDKEELHERCLVTKKRVDPNTGEEKEVRAARFSADVLNRDIVAIASPLFREHECNEDTAIHYLENMELLSRDKSVYESAEKEVRTVYNNPNAAQAAVDEQIDLILMRRTIPAVNEELSLVENTMRETDQYIEQHPSRELLKNPSSAPTAEQVYEMLSATQPLFERMQGILARTNRIIGSDYFVRLPMAMQERWKGIYAKVYTYKKMPQQVVNDYKATIELEGATGFKSFAEWEEEANAEFKRITAMAREKELERIHKFSPKTSEKAIDAARQITEDMRRKLDSSMEDYKAMRDAGEINVEKRDIRMVTDITNGYLTNEQGEPLNAEEAAKKEHDIRMLKAYYGEDEALTAEVMNAVWDEVLAIQITPEMLEEDYIVENAVKMRTIMRKFLILDNWQGDHPGVSEKYIPKEKRDKVLERMQHMNLIVYYLTSVMHKVGIDPNNSELGYANDMNVDGGYMEADMYKAMMPAELQALQNIYNAG
jgi:hypothetical protein